MNEQRSLPGRVWHHAMGRMVVVGVLAFVCGIFAGFVPMWSGQRSADANLQATRDQARRLELQTLLGSAMADASRGSYEAARQRTSDFFMQLDTATGEGPNAVFSPSVSLDPFFAERDNLITLLARSDPAVVPRLAELYVKFREMVPPREQQTTMLR